MPYSVSVTPPCCFALFLEFLCKECPRVHIFIDRLELKDIPEEQMYMRRWLHERFEIKDKWVAMCRTSYLKKLSSFFCMSRCTQDFCVASSASCRALGREVVLVLLCIFCVIPMWLKLLLRRLGSLGFRPALDWRAVNPCVRQDSFSPKYSTFIFLKLSHTQPAMWDARGRQASRRSLIVAS